MAGQALGHLEMTMFGQWGVQSIEKGVECALRKYSTAVEVRWRYY